MSTFTYCYAFVAHATVAFEVCAPPVVQCTASGPCATYGVRAPLCTACDVHVFGVLPLVVDIVIVCFATDADNLWRVESTVVGW